MIEPLSQQRIEKYWATELGCSIEVLRAPGSKVIVGSDNGKAIIVRYYDCCIWHVPRRFASAVERGIESFARIDHVFNDAFISALFGPTVQLILGPAPIAYCDGALFQPGARLPPCRKLTGEDAVAVERLANACGPEAWSHGGVKPGEHPAVFGCFAYGELVSVASYEIWGDAIAHVCVVTAPTYRGRGFAKSAGSAATAEALEAGLVPQWRTLASNVASVRVGRAIGYVPMAASFLVRLRAE